VRAGSSRSTRSLTNYVRYLDIELVLFELLALTSYVRYLEIVLVLFELLAHTNYVRYLDIKLMLFDLLLGLTNYVPALCLGSTHSL
jgi:hypothetical protein